MTSDRLPVMVVYGTRPEAIKVAPVIRELQSSRSLRPVCVVTGQHREMLDQVNRVFDISPDADLDLMEPGQTLNGIAARVFELLDAELLRYRPAAVLVQGDTTTVMAAGIAAFNRSIPLVHLEAGLRSRNLASPFPEEGNRRLVSQVASLHLAPTEQARKNLLEDGVREPAIAITGNTVIDALHWAVAQPVSFSDPLLASVFETNRPMLLLTAHRRENLGERMKEIGVAIRDIARTYPELLIVWPAHKNPHVREALLPYIGDVGNVITTEPVGYHEFTHLLRRTKIVLTDSGGLQEEAPSLGKPVLVLRDNTERPEAVEAGTAKLVGTEPERIKSAVNELLESPTLYDKMAGATNPFGDGRAAPRCVTAIEELIGRNNGSSN